MSNNLAIPENSHDGYVLVGAAGVWDRMPQHLAEGFEAAELLSDIDLPENELTLTEEQQIALGKLAEFQAIPPYPYLQLLQNKYPPTKDRPAYLYMTALTTTPEEPLLPVDEQAAHDMLHLTVETNRVLVEDTPAQHDPVVYDPAQESSPAEPARTVRALLFKRVKPIGFHLPVIEALDRFVKANGVDWDPASLTDVAGMDREFYHFEAVVPAKEVALTLGGERHTVPVSALVAAGLRTAICETVRLARSSPILRALEEDPDLLKRFQQALQEGVTDPWRAALESGAKQPRQIEQ